MLLAVEIMEQMITASKMADLQTENAPIRILPLVKLLPMFHLVQYPGEDVIDEASGIVKSAWVYRFEYW